VADVARPTAASWIATRRALHIRRQRLGVILLEPFLRGVHIGEHLDVLGIADLLARVDVDKDGPIGPSPNPEKFAVSFE
jgi:hypothetical protein